MKKEDKMTCIICEQEKVYNRISTGHDVCIDCMFEDEPSSLIFKKLKKLFVDNGCGFMYDYTTSMDKRQSRVLF